MQTRSITPGIYMTDENNFNTLSYKINNITDVCFDKIIKITDNMNIEDQDLKKILQNKFNLSYNKEIAYIVNRDRTKINHGLGMFCPKCGKYIPNPQLIVAVYDTLKSNALQECDYCYTHIICNECNSIFDNFNTLFYGQPNLIDENIYVWPNDNTLTVSDIFKYIKPVSNNKTGYNSLHKNTKFNKFIFNFKKRQIYNIYIEYTPKKKYTFYNVTYAECFNFNIPYNCRENIYNIYLKHYTDKDYDKNIDKYYDSNKKCYILSNIKYNLEGLNKMIPSDYDIQMHIASNGNKKNYNILSTFKSSCIGEHYRSKILNLQKQFLNQNINEQDYINQLVQIFNADIIFEKCKKNPYELFNEDYTLFVYYLLTAKLFKYYLKYFNEKHFKTIFNYQKIINENLRTPSSTLYLTKYKINSIPANIIDMEHLFKIFNSNYLKYLLSPTDNSFFSTNNKYHNYEKYIKKPLKMVIEIINTKQLKDKKFLKQFNQCNDFKELFDYQNNKVNNNASSF